jgi:hypothetical protein
VERLRVVLERVAHLLGIAIIAWLLFDSLRPQPERSVEVVAIDELATSLGRWSTASAPERVHLLADSTIAQLHRQWLAALVGAGTEVSWEGDAIIPLAATVNAVPDPDGGTRIVAAAPRGTMVILEDDVGVIDSVQAGAAGARFLTHTPVSAVRVRAGASTAESAPHDSVGFGRILVVGPVGWESSMVIGALEERGWEVDARLALSPKGDVLQGGSRVAPDTGRYSAVVVFDSVSLLEPAQLVRYVREGGGLVITARGSTAPALTPLRVGSIARRVPAVEPFDTAHVEPRRSLALSSITAAADALPLEMRDDLWAVAVRRVERGRVAMVGYDDTWRWRMAGGRDGLDQHRAWWAAVVGAVAHVEYAPRRAVRSVDEAPLANMVQLLGAPSRGPAQAEVEEHGIPYGIVFAVLSALLLLLWLSRRLRGAA